MLLLLGFRAFGVCFVLFVGVLGGGFRVSKGRGRVIGIFRVIRVIEVMFCPGVCVMTGTSSVFPYSPMSP